MIDENADIIWERDLLSVNMIYAYHVSRTSDSGFAISGRFGPQTAVYSSVYLEKTDSLGNTTYTSLYNIETAMPINFFPNPATDKLYINACNMINEKKLLFTLTDMQGRSVLNEQYINSPLPVRGVGGEAIDVSTLPNGIYIATLKGKEKEVRSKVIIQR